MRTGCLPNSAFLSLMSNGNFEFRVRRPVETSACGGSIVQRSSMKPAAASASCSLARFARVLVLHDDDLHRSADALRKEVLEAQARWDAAWRKCWAPAFVRTATFIRHRVMASCRPSTNVGVGPTSMTCSRPCCGAGVVRPKISICRTLLPKIQDLARRLAVPNDHHDLAVGPQEDSILAAGRELHLAQVLCAAEHRGRRAPGQQQLGRHAVGTHQAVVVVERLGHDDRVGAVHFADTSRWTNSCSSRASGSLCAGTRRRLNQAATESPIRQRPIVRQANRRIDSVSGG